MTRIKTGTTRRKRHKKVLKQTKGHQGVRHRLYSRAKESLIHALKYSYAHRRKKKGDMRRLWTIRINAAVRANGLSYSQLMYGLRLKQVEIYRKQLLIKFEFADILSHFIKFSAGKYINICQS